MSRNRKIAYFKKKKKKKMLIVGGRELGLNGGHDEVEAIGRARAPMQLRTAV